MWSFQTYYTPSGSPSVAGGIVFIGSGNYFYALNATTGTVLWSYYSSNSFDSSSSPAIANGVVFMGEYGLRFLAFGARATPPVTPTLTSIALIAVLVIVAVVVLTFSVIFAKRRTGKRGDQGPTPSAPQA